MPAWFKNYKGIASLIAGILIGSAVGFVFGKKAEVLKPIGDIFLNLLFVAVIPLVFFCISSSIASIDRGQKVGRLLGTMTAVYLGTVLVAALVTMAALWLFPVTAPVAQATIPDVGSKGISGDQLSQLFTTSEFFQLLSRKNMLAMIIFALLTGFGVLRAGEKGEVFAHFLTSGANVFQQVFILIMKIGPVGLGAYFAYQVAEFGPSLFGTYAQVMGVGYGVSLFYYALFFSIYAFLAGGVKGIHTYWKNNIIPSVTAVGTCSSIATIPANLEAAKRMGVSDIVNGVTIPLGATLHKDGSSVSSILKMGVVFAMFGRGFTGADVILLALGMTVLVSIVEGGIPNGGYVGELLFISVYGFPPEALPPAIIIGTLIDPVATLLNATGDTVAAMLIDRLMRKSEPEVLELKN